MESAFNVHYSGNDTVGTVLERLERSSKQLEQAVNELGEQVQAVRQAQADDRRELENVRGKRRGCAGARGGTMTARYVVRELTGYAITPAGGTGTRSREGLTVWVADTFRVGLAVQTWTTEAIGNNVPQHEKRRRIRRDAKALADRLNAEEER